MKVATTQLNVSPTEVGYHFDVIAFTHQVSLISTSSFFLDKNDKGEESEEEIWAEAPSASKAASTNNSNTASTPKNQDPDEYGGSTDVDDPDTEDEIEM